MISQSAKARTILVVGGTGHLGRKVIRAAVDKGYTVRALLRAGSSLPPALPPVDTVRADLLDRDSLRTACEGVDAIVTTAIGYSNRRKSDRGASIDRDGQFHLIDAARVAGVRRFVFTSVLTCDRAPEVPHFHDKWLVEQRLERSGLDWCALRPGAFIDQSKDFWIDGLRRGRLDALGDPSVAWSYVHTDDLACFLVEAIGLSEQAPRRIDVGCDRPVSAREIALQIGRLLGRDVRVRAMPWVLASPMLTVLAIRDPWQADFKRMFEYMLRGRYVADLSAQRRWFGEPPPIEGALARYLNTRNLGRVEIHHG